jgi:hypothetical protein
MLHLFKIFWDICRLKAGPQDVPAGRNLLIAAIIAAVIIDSFSTSILMPGLGNIEILQIVALYNIILITAMYLLLWMIGYAARGLQTLTALLATGLLISLVLLPGLLVINSAAEEVKSFAFYVLADTIWRLTVNTHIFRHAFSVNLMLAMILSLSYFIFGLFVADILIPTQKP